MRIKTQGYHGRYPYLDFSPGPSKCGSINDGVVLEHRGNRTGEGGWVISFRDLKRMYRAAEKARMEAKDGR